MEEKELLKTIIDKLQKTKGDLQKSIDDLQIKCRNLQEDLRLERDKELALEAEFKQKGENLKK